ncbi:TPA: DNA polymerase III subunit gamma/tau, partial [Patescibacteria group bacterium]|nr:DNA polymerase III subunit gamma/tau [Patescibacteria group bacterium]
MAENKALYRRWRPQVFADLVGQHHVKQTILNAIKAGQPSHAYLFAGPRGTGKTSMARLLAKAVNCLDQKEGEPCGKCANCVALANGQMMDV